MSATNGTATVSKLEDSYDFLPFRSNRTNGLTLQTDGGAKSLSLERKYIRLLEKRIATLEALVEAENKTKVDEQMN